MEVWEYKINIWKSKDSNENILSDKYSFPFFKKVKKRRRKYPE